MHTHFVGVTAEGYTPTQCACIYFWAQRTAVNTGDRAHIQGCHWLIIMARHRFLRLRSVIFTLWLAYALALGLEVGYGPRRRCLACYSHLGDIAVHFPIVLIIL